MENKESGQALEGVFCHTFHADGRYQYQGYVVSYLGNSHYLVRLYSAGDGLATYSQIVTLNDMRAGGWRFYETEERWRDAADAMNEAMSRDDYKVPGHPPTLGLS